MPSDNRELVDRWMRQRWEAKNVDGVRACEASDFTDWEGHVPPTQQPAFRARYLDALPDLVYHVDTSYEVGPFVLYRGHWRARQVNPWPGVAMPVGMIEGRRMDLFRCRDGRIAEHWGTGTDPAAAIRHEAGRRATAPPVGEAVFRLVTECLNHRDRRALGALLTAGAVGSDIERILSLLLFLASVPKARVRIQHIEAAGEIVLALAIIECPHGGIAVRTWLRRRCRVPLIILCRMEGQRIDQIWMNYDDLGMARQLAE